MAASPAHRHDVITLGEALALFVAEEPGPLDQVTRFMRLTAGAETNVAIGLARLGLRVGWLSRLGDDSMGRFLRAAIARDGVDCSRVALHPGERTAFMFKARADDGGDPAIEYHRRGSAASALGPQDVDAQWVAGARHLHVSGVFPALTASTLAATRRAIALMREAGGTVSFDPNLRPSLWPDTQTMRETLNDLARGCDWVLPGIEEARLLTGRDEPAAMAAFYRERGARLVIVKLGPQGAWVDAEGLQAQVPAFAVERVVDTVGAGDGFAVGVISALLAGRDPAAAARRGCWIGARAVQVRGDTEGLPSAAELAAAGL